MIIPKRMVIEMNEELVAKMRTLVDEAYKKDVVLHVSEAFNLYPVEEEVHQGRLEHFLNK